jgi:hypothetical protein
VARALEVRFGTGKDTFLSLQIVKRAHPDPNDFWDGNWLVTNVELQIKDTSLQTTGFVRADELAHFNEQLQNAAQEQSGEITFNTIEGWINIAVKIHPTGEVCLSGFVTNDLTHDELLKFEIELDHSYLRGILRQLMRITTTYPVFGTR